MSFVTIKIINNFGRLYFKS